MRRGFLVVAGSTVLLAGAVLGMRSVTAGPPPETHTVAMHGVKAAMKHEANVEGFLTPLNSRFKLRATEADFAPGATLGDHLHVGPGIRMVLAGELVVVDAETGSEQRVPAGGYFYEAGDKSFRVQNRTEQPARLLVVELLPADLEGTAMAPTARRTDLEQLGENLRTQLCSSR